jgi:DNA polymerase-3 subunit delta'
VIGAISYRPFEEQRSVYVIEAADAMAEESQNALLKTLEEPPHYAHLLLVTSDPGGLLETVRSRCQRIAFNSLPREAVERRLAEHLELPPETLAALAALADGDLDRARFLGSERGARLRELSQACARSARAGDVTDRPWVELIKIAADVGTDRAEAVEAAAAARAEEFGKGRDAQRVKREGAEAAKRAQRRERTAALDTGLALAAAWFVDLIACAEGAPELVRNVDRASELDADSAGLDAGTARRAAEAAMLTRRTLQVNVSEELALEALFHRIAAGFGAS